MTIADYGSGTKPLLDSSDAIASGGWTKTGGLTSVYQVAVATQTSGAALFITVFENGVFLQKATSAADADTKPGSFYPSAASGSLTLYVHASDGSNPASNGKTYEFSSRLNSLDAGSVENVTIRNIITRRPISTSGSLKIGRGCNVSDCEANDGNLHNILAMSRAVLTRVTMTNAYAGLNDGPIAFVAFDATPDGAAASCVDCVVAMSGLPPMTYGVAAYSGHTSGGNYSTVDFVGCSASGVTNGYSAQNTNQLRILKSGNNRASVSLLAGFDSANGVQAATNTTIDGLDVTFGASTTNSNAVVANLNNSTVSINDMSVTDNGATSSFGFNSGYQAAPNVTITNSTFSGVAIPVTILVDSFTAVLTNNSYVAPATRNYDLGTPSALTSDFNNFNGNTKPFNANGTTYANLTAWKNGTGQDAHSAN